MSHELVIDDLVAGVDGKQILNGLSLVIRSGEVHAVMGPNGTGKSTLSYILMGKPGYEVRSGSVTLDGVDLLGLDPYERASAGLFLAMQYPTEVPGVTAGQMLVASAQDSGEDIEAIAGTLATEARRIGLEADLLGRSLNVDLSGGEKKRLETAQMTVLRPKFAILDEIDSGLDIDALKAVTRRIEASTEEDRLGVLAITHYSRLFKELKPDTVHIMVGGKIVASGGPDLADKLEEEGYKGFGFDETARENEVGIRRPEASGPFGNPFEEGFPDPFAET